MAGLGPTVTLTFAGDDRNLSRTLAALAGKTDAAGDGIRRVGTIAALAFPAVGYGAGAVTALTGVLGTLPAVALGGAAAIGALAVGFHGFGDALSNMDDPAKFAEAIAKLSPAARETAVALRDLRPQFTALRSTVQEALFANVAGELRGLTGALLPQTTEMLRGIASGFNLAALETMGWMRSGEGLAVINPLLENIKTGMAGMTGAIAPIVEAFTRLAAVGAESLPGWGEALTDAATRFAAFIEQAQQTGQLAEWIETGKQAFAVLWETLGNLLTTVWDLGVAFGPGLLGALLLASGALSGVASFVRENSAVMVPLIGIVAGLVATFKTAMAVVGVVNAIRNATVLWTAAQWLLNSAFLANPITWVVIAIAALVAAVIYAWNNCESFRNVVLAVWAGIKSAFSAGVEWVKSALAWFGSLPGRFGTWFGGAKDRAVAMLGSLLAWVRGLPGRILGALGNLGSLLSNSGRAMIDGFLNGLKGAWSKVISWADSAMSWLRSFWPFSPAKLGAFSGRGYVTYSGAALVGDFAKSLAKGEGQVGAAAASLMSAAALPFDAGASLEVAGAAPAGWTSPARPSSTASGAPITHVTVHVQGSIRSDRDLVGLIRDEFDRGGFRGVRGTR